MGDIHEHTFSVEVLTFSSGPEDEILVRSVSDAFGIGFEDALGIVQRAPIRVKRGADGAMTKQLVGQLMTLGADVRIRNEQTGDEKTYKASLSGAASIPPVAISSPMPLTSVFPRPAKDSARITGDPGPDSSPISSLLRPGVPLVHAVTIKTSPEGTAGENDDRISEPGPPSPVRAADRRASSPGVDRQPSSPGVNRQPSLPGVTRQPSNPGGDRISEPLPISQSKQPDIAMCASCSRRTEKGSNCAFCGWSNIDSKRYCRQCKKPIIAASSWTSSQAGGILIAALAAGAVGLWFFGALGGAAAVSLVVGAGIAANGAFTSYRCAPCKLSINEALTLDSREERALRRARSKYYVFGAFFVVLSVGLLVPLTRSTSMLIDSFDVAWRATPPRTHTKIENKLFTVKTDLGSLRLVTRVSDNPRLSIRTYLLGQIALPTGFATKLDDAGLERVMRQAIEAAVPGSKVGPSEPLRRHDVPGRQGTFEATIDGQAMTGKARVHYFNDEIVLLLFTATSAEAAADSSGTDYLDSLVIERPAAP